MSDAAIRYTDYVYSLLDKRLKEIDARLGKIEQRDKISETAYSLPYVDTLANAPTGLNQPELRWIANGRKPTEGAGLGTGVPAIFDPTSNTWFSMFSGTAVTV